MLLQTELFCDYVNLEKLIEKIYDWDWDDAIPCVSLRPVLTIRHFIIRLFGIIDTRLRMCSVIKVALATIIPLAYIHSLLIICTYRSFAQTSLSNFIDRTPRNFFLTILRCSEDCQRLSREFDGNRDSQFDYLCSYK